MQNNYLHHRDSKEVLPSCAERDGWHEVPLRGGTFTILTEAQPISSSVFRGADGQTKDLRDLTHADTQTIISSKLRPSFLYEEAGTEPWPTELV